MLTLVIFGVLVGFMFLGVPIAVSMGLTAVLTFVFLGQGFVVTMVAQRMYSSTTAFTLLAIPFFILAGNLMNSGGITRRVFRFALAHQRDLCEVLRFGNQAREFGRNLCEIQSRIVEGIAIPGDQDHEKRVHDD